MKYPDDFIDKIIQGNVLDVMKDIPDNSVDLAIVDPPYFKIITIDWKGNKHEWDNQWDAFNEYLEFIEKVGIEIKRILKPTGSLYVFQDDKNVAYTQIVLDKLGFYLENHIVWVKPNNMPNRGWKNFRCFTPITERILFYSKEQRNTNLCNLTDEQIAIMKPIVEYFIEQKRKIKQIFKFKTDKEFNEFINKVTGTRSVASRHYFTYSQFVFPTKEMYKKLQSINNIIEGSEVFKKEYEVFKKEYEVFKKEYEVFKKEYEDLRRYFRQDKNYTDVWTFNITSTKEKTFHPTQKPVKLIERIIKCSSRENDIILDPFIGSGTTAIACKQLNRHYIGIEINPEYVKIARRRLANIPERLEKYF